MTLRSLRIFIGLRIMDARDSAKFIKAISDRRETVNAVYAIGFRDGQRELLEPVGSDAYMASIARDKAAALEAEHDEHVKRW